MKKNIRIIFYLLLVGFSCNNLHAFNAGILAYTKIDGDAYFLLGRESKQALPHARFTWCDCGGAGNPGETIQQTGAREFSEETNAAWGKVVLGEGHSAQKYLKASIDYITQHMNPAEIRPPATPYSLFLAEIDYLGPEEIINGPVKHPEKDDFIWVNAKDFIKQISNGAAFYLTQGEKLTIRDAFQPFFTNQKTRQQIEKIIELTKETKVQPPAQSVQKSKKNSLENILSQLTETLETLKNSFYQS